MRTFSRSFHRFSICQLIDDLYPTYNINYVQGVRIYQGIRMIKRSERYHKPKARPYAQTFLPLSSKFSKSKKFAGELA